MGFPDFSQSKVLVVGDIMLDQYWYGSMNRIASEAPTPVIKIDKIVDSPGGAANVAMNIVSLGGYSRLLGLVGSDESACVLKKKLDFAHVEWDFLTINTYSTIRKLRVISHNQQLIRLDFEKNYSYSSIAMKNLLGLVELYLPQCKILVLSDYGKGCLNCVEEIIVLARAMKKLIIIDPKGSDLFRYKGATILTPNISEFEGMVGCCNDEAVLIRRAKEVIEDADLSALLITRADQGMTLFKRNEDPVYFPVRAKKICNVTGAGDTVVGTLSAALSAGINLERSCFFANIAADIVIGKFGTSSTNVAEMQCTVREYESKNIVLGVIDEEVLKQILLLVRSWGEKIVMTNGIFDILHVGHVSYLTDAKKMGDRLIVAVNSDDSTKRLKGKMRPVNTLKKRMFVLSALSVVDWVVPFYEDTPERLITDLSPDILVKGGDYQISDIIGGKEVINQGGKVCVLDYKFDSSTSRIISDLQYKKDSNIL